MAEYGKTRREGSRLEVGEIEEIEAAASYGLSVSTDQVLGMVEVIRSLARRLGRRFEENTLLREQVHALQVDREQVASLGPEGEVDEVQRDLEAAQATAQSYAQTLQAAGEEVERLMSVDPFMRHHLSGLASILRLTVQTPAAPLERGIEAGPQSDGSTEKE